MYKLIIVDDEFDVRSRISQSIEKFDCGFEIVGTYENGLDALEGVNQYSPDLVITDIRMPFMTGIELIEKIRETKPLTKVIIITGFDEFDYAKQAIDLGVIGFLTKPILGDDLKVIIKKAKEDLDEEYYRNTSLANMEQFIKESLPIIRENDLHRLINLSNIDEKFAKKLEYDGILLNYKYFAVCISDIDSDVARDDIEKHEINLLTVKKYVSEGLQNTFFHETFMKNDYVISIIKSNDEITTSQLEKCFEYSLMKAKKYADFTLSVGISKIYKTMNFKDMYKEAQKALEYRNAMGGSEVYSYSNIATQLSNVKIIDDSDYKNLTYAIHFKTFSEIIEILKELKNKVASPEYRPTYAFNISGILNAILKACDNLPMLYEEKTDFHQKMLDFKTIDDLFGWFNSLIEKVQNINNDIISDNIQKNLNKIIDYIDSHYTDNDLSLELLAEKVNISISYVSAILKKEKNTTFVKYLTTLRMEKAKELLKNPNLKIVDIAESIGFSEPYYFSHSFKKYQGVSPKEYRTNESK